MNVFSRLSIYSAIIALAALTGCVVDRGADSYGNDQLPGRNDMHRRDGDYRNHHHDRNSWDDRGDDRRCNERDDGGHCRDGDRHDG